ncbi:hypothetical protein MASR2M29_01370 [Spirochaetota bacterium]
MLQFLPGLTSTKKQRIPAFVAALASSKTRHIALFPTCLLKEERYALYRTLETIPGLAIPHVHLRSDCGTDELCYLAERFKTVAFNIHPESSKHSFGPIPEAFANMFFIENVEELPEPVELEGRNGVRPGGLCPDFSHLEGARLSGNAEYVEKFIKLLSSYPVGCCHISAIRPGIPNNWSGGFDHHEFGRLSDLDYLHAYKAYFPDKWASLELENSFEEQLLAIQYLKKLLGSD